MTLTTPQRRLLKLLSETGNNIRKDRMIYRFHLYTRGGRYLETVNTSTMEALIRLKYVTRVIISEAPFCEYQVSVSGLIALDENPATDPIDIRPKHNRHSRYEN